MRRLGGGLAILLGGALVAVSAEKPADLILKNGKVVTLSLIHISEPTRPY